MTTYPEDPTLPYASAHDQARAAVERLAEFVTEPWLSAADHASINALIRSFHNSTSAERFLQIAEECSRLENTLTARKSSTTGR